MKHLKSLHIDTVSAGYKLEVVTGTYVILGSDNLVNAVCAGTPKQQLATANLFKAAPELLEACKVALKRLEVIATYSDMYSPSTQKMLTDAIVKAEGKEE